MEIFICLCVDTFCIALISDILNEIKMKIQDIKTYFICPAHNEKYKERAQHMKSLLTSLGFKNWIHWTSGTENYPSCLTQAMLSILQENMNNEPILILEDDVEFTGRDDV